MKQLFEKYITPQGEINIKQFQYKGGDDSPLYRNLYSPPAVYLVEHIIPPWVA